jgi:hypothetical protein
MLRKSFFVIFYICVLANKALQTDNAILQAVDLALD